ncbi:hypothetical protein COT58_00930 [Candidatus Micrarchaeota archaeon CG09_land_8_20_14_0_10_60_16]|nr:MAG: hypothetical protein COT58_00930 [Candidatus Micrarchaeota archaeon CG09_land_8_20_14_0_10_60_16]
MKAQAAIFDGITFLLLTMFSVSLMYVTVAGYGQQEDAVMRSAHVMNYMQSFTKSIYFVNAQTLAKICSPSDDSCFREGQVYPWYAGLNDADTGCNALKDYLGSISVTDLLKRDLADPGITLLDDKYGGIPARGKTATRCAAKELMKPFIAAGYKYYLEVVDPTSRQLYSNGDPVPIAKDSQKITNSDDEKVIGKPGQENYERMSGCEEAVKAGYKVLSVSAPFRVTPAKDESSTQETGAEKHFVLRVCIWPSA